MNKRPQNNFEPFNVLQNAQTSTIEAVVAKCRKLLFTLITLVLYNFCTHIDCQKGEMFFNHKRAGVFFK